MLATRKRSSARQEEGKRVMHAILLQRQRMGRGEKDPVGSVERELMRHGHVRTLFQMAEEEGLATVLRIIF